MESIDKVFISVGFHAVFGKLSKDVDKGYIAASKFTTRRPV